MCVGIRRVNGVWRMGVLVEVESLAVQEELAGKVESRHDDVLPGIRAIDFERDATYVVVADGGKGVRDERALA